MKANSFGRCNKNDTDMSLSILPEVRPDSVPPRLRSARTEVFCFSIFSTFANIHELDNDELCDMVVVVESMSTRREVACAPLDSSNVNIDESDLEEEEDVLDSISSIVLQ